MQLKAERDPLLDGLQTAARALSTRTTLPSLGGIMLIAAGGKLTARATDSELAVSVEVDAEVEGEGQLLLPGRLLADVARALPQGPVTISERSAEHDVEIKAGTAQFHLRLLDAEDFPRLPELEGETITMPAPALAETVERVARAASRDEVRPILTGIMVSVEGNSLTMVATDSYRLSVKRTELADAVAEPFEANVPARAMRELARVVSQGGVARLARFAHAAAETADGEGRGARQIPAIGPREIGVRQAPQGRQGVLGGFLHACQRDNGAHRVHGRPAVIQQHGGEGGL